MSSLSQAVDIVRELARSHSNSNLPAGQAAFKTTTLSTTALVKGTYALKGIPGSPILSAVVPTQIFEIIDLIPSKR